MPERLITPLPKVREESSFADYLQRAVLPFMREDEAVCRAPFNPLCVSLAACVGEVECEIQTWQAIREEIFRAGVGREAQVGTTSCGMWNDGTGQKARSVQNHSILHKDH